MFKDQYCVSFGIVIKHKVLHNLTLIEFLCVGPFTINHVEMIIQW
jgi:hypothetical protein